MFYSAFYDRVFIANYVGGDIVVAQLERTPSGGRSAGSRSAISRF